jgi:hypothetical protein
VSLRGRDVVISDLRMGLEPHYAFYFKVGEAGKVGEVGELQTRLTVPEQLAAVREFNRMPVLWARIWDQSVLLSPPGQ